MVEVEQQLQHGNHNVKAWAGPPMPQENPGTLQAELPLTNRT